MIYREFYDMFDFDSFHMGADEVHLGCWNSSSSIAEFMENDIRMKDRDEQCKEDKYCKYRLWDCIWSWKKLNIQKRLYGVDKVWVPRQN